MPLKTRSSLLLSIFLAAPGVISAQVNVFDPPPAWYLLDMAQCYWGAQYYTSGRQIFGTSAAQIEAAFAAEAHEALEREKADAVRQFTANGYGATLGESSMACEPMYHSSPFLGWTKPRPDAWKGHITCKARTQMTLTYPTVPYPWERPFDSNYTCVVWWVPNTESCTIALSGPESTGTRLGEIEPGKVLTGLRAQVECNGMPVAASVTITPESVPLSGGHAHHSAQRPAGVILPAVVNSDDPFTFNAPEAAGDHRLKAHCIDRECTQAGPDTVWVGVEGLLDLQADPAYVLISPNPDRRHPGNHYVNASTQAKIRSLAAAYHKLFPSDPLLHLNDASLERGGLFDLAANWSPRPGHSTHRYGTDIDVRSHEFYHDPKSSVPTYNYVDFMLLASRRGCLAGIHSGGSQNEHFHLYCR